MFDVCTKQCRIYFLELHEELLSPQSALRSTLLQIHILIIMKHNGPPIRAIEPLPLG
jgi:hypothetical protein